MKMKKYKIHIEIGNVMYLILLILAIILLFRWALLGVSYIVGLILDGVDYIKFSLQRK